MHGDIAGAVMNNQIVWQCVAQLPTMMLVLFCVHLSLRAL